MIIDRYEIWAGYSIRIYESVNTYLFLIVVRFIGDPDVIIVQLVKLCQLWENMATSIKDANEEVSTLPIIAAATVKLPTFWPESPKVWFAQAESQFAIKGISSDETKYHHVVASLDQAMAKRVVDLLTSPPTVGTRYSVLKERLLSTFTLSSYQRAQRLIRVSPLGDRKPSELMDDMLGFLGEHPGCFLFKTLFMDQLPEDIRTHLIPHLDDFSPRELALAADKYMSTRPPSINVVSKVKNKSGLEERSDKFCRFHKRWGSRAFRCEAPCSFIKPSHSRIHSIQGNDEYGHQ